MTDDDFFADVSDIKTFKNDPENIKKKNDEILNEFNYDPVFKDMSNYEIEAKNENKIKYRTTL